MEKIYENNRIPVEKNNPALSIIEDKCVHCGACVRTCQKMPSIAGFYKLDEVDEAICLNCGQCILACPMNCLHEKYDYQYVKEEIANHKIVCIQTAPAVRVSLAEEFGMPNGTNVEGKMVALLKKLGFTYVFDTTFGADLTIMEEASEFVERINNNGVFPQFTSCCPAWVKFAEIYHPELLNNLSSAKSPIAMQGTIIKTYFAKKMGIDPANIVNVDLTPCTAKKAELLRPELTDSGKYNNVPDMKDNDYCITARELASWAKEANIDFASLEDAEFDSLFGLGSGAGIIFGSTGGVTEAAMRTAYYLLTGDDAPKDLLHFDAVRGLDDVKEASLTINNKEIHVAVIHQTSNARKFLEDKENLKKYHFIEVMNCKGGCVGGGGQPKHRRDQEDAIKARSANLYQQDEQMTKRCSYQNPDITRIYDEFLEKPLSHIAHELLHTTYNDKSCMLHNKKD